MIRCCIFDLDGTLLDTLPTIKYHLNNTLAVYGLPPATDEDTKIYIGDGAYQLIYRAFTARGISDPDVIARALAEYKAAYDASPYYLTTVYDGIEEMLDALTAAGVTLAVLSNKPDLAAGLVVRNFLPDRFILVRGGRDGVALKPDPAAALDMLTELGFSPDECAFVGDTSVDITTGKNMGASISVGVLWGFRDRAELATAGADIIVENACDILAAVGVSADE